MRIATTYENGNICQHFGRSPQFKIFNVENGEVVESVVVDAVGSGHQALADFLSSQNVNIVLAGGIGHGAIISLAMAGIDIIPGIAGNADTAIDQLLKGQLVAGAAGCGCGCGGHEHEESSCGCGGHHEAETCSIDEGASGCGCGCGAHQEPETCSIDEGASGCGCSVDKNDKGGCGH